MKNFDLIYNALNKKGKTQERGENKRTNAYEFSGTRYKKVPCGFVLCPT